MAKSVASISIKPFNHFLDAITTAVAPHKTTPAFTFILGSGFSNGLIPTAWEMAMYDIPWWIKGPKAADGSYGQPRRNDPAFEQNRRALWRSVHAEHPDAFAIDEHGLPVDQPDNIAKCYQTIMRASKGLNSAEMRHDYLRAAVRRTRNEINYAHLFLAGILQAQYTKKWTETYQHGRPFCGTIFTTNFDSLLQRALQLNNQIFFVSDEPEHYSTKPRDDHEAVHLIQSHGSIFRPFLANTDREIENLKKKISGNFVDYFENQGVIVMGYGGWDDAIMTALSKCKKFSGNLYWCDMSPDKPEERLRSNVVKLLKKHPDSAYYVPLPTGGANIALQEIHRALGLRNYPQVLINPIAPLIESIESLQLPQIPPGLPRKIVPEELGERSPIRTLADIDDPAQVKGGILGLLSEFQKEILEPQSAIGKFTLGRALAFDGQIEPAEKLLSEVVELPAATVQMKVESYFALSWCKNEQENDEGVISACSGIVTLPGAPVDQIAKAYYMRGMVKSMNGNHKGGISDYSEIIALEGAPLDVVASAYFNRGIAKGQQRDFEGAISDYNVVISLEQSPIHLVAKAYYIRGLTRNQQSDKVGALSDLKAVLGLEGVDDEIIELTKSLLAELESGDESAPEAEE